MSGPEHQPVLTVDDLLSLKLEEVAEGYRDGHSGEPEPGNNRSRAYWHGWRCGAIDGGHIPVDAAARELARNVAPGGRIDPRLVEVWALRPARGSVPLIAR